MLSLPLSRSVGCAAPLLPLPHWDTEARLPQTAAGWGPAMGCVLWGCTAGLLLVGHCMAQTVAGRSAGQQLRAVKVAWAAELPRAPSHWLAALAGPLTLLDRRLLRVPGRQVPPGGTAVVRGPPLL